MELFEMCTLSTQKLQEYPFHKEITFGNFCRKALDTFEVLQVCSKMSGLSQNKPKSI